MDWMFEGGWFLYSTQLVMVVSLCLLWFFQRNNYILVIAAIPGLLSVVFFLADVLVVTSREQAVAILEKIELAINSGRLDACVDYLDDRFVTRSGMDKKAVREWLVKTRSREMLDGCVFWGNELVQATQVDTLKLSTMVKVRSRQGLYREGIYRVEFVFVKNKNQPVGGILSFRLFDPLTNDNEINPGI